MAINSISCELLNKENKEQLAFIENFGGLLQTPQELALDVLELAKNKGFRLDINKHFLKIKIETIEESEFNTDFDKNFSLEELNEALILVIYDTSIITNTRAFKFYNAFESLDFLNQNLNLKLDIEFLFKDGSRLIFLNSQIHQGENFIRFIASKN